MARNYSDLSPYDFEVLVRDLLQKETGLRLETFPPGRDGGVDVRLYRDAGEQLVVQCKHTPGKRYVDIKAQLAKEAEKVSGRFTVRYILVTTASLTRANKREISRTFRGVKLAENDIWGLDDIENYLRLHPEVEQNNFKLWITSTAVLQRLLHSEIYERSSGLVDHMQARAQLYVPSDAFPHAQNILKRHRTCLISGQPGIGKTTLAEMLLLHYLADGWSVHVASEDVAEIDRVWRRGEKQVFFYDDFLGQNSLVDKMNKNEDSRLVQVIKRVQAVPDKLLILTTREYILQQAEQIYEPLRRATSLDDGKFILDIRHYSKHQRAHILYNHIYFSSLSKSARVSVLEGRRYRKLIEHANYNPRLIELMVATFTERQGLVSSFADYAESSLRDPSSLWETIFEEQLSEIERNVLVVLATFQSRVSVKDLEVALREYESMHRGVSLPHRKLMLALKRLQGTFLVMGSVATTDPEGGTAGSIPLVYFANPSFSDYIYRYLSTRPDEINEVIESCVFFEQLQTVWNLGQSRFGADYLLDTLFAGRGYPSQGVDIQSLDLDRFAVGLARTRTQRTCYWVSNGIFGREGVEKSEMSIRARDLQILRMNDRVDGGLPMTEEIGRVQDRCRERLFSAPVEGVDLDSEREIILYLAKVGVDETCLIHLRDRALGIALSKLERPADFEIAFNIFDIPNLPDVSGQEERVDELRAEFLNTVEGWEVLKAREAISVGDCEDATSDVIAAAEALGVSVRTPELDQAYEYWLEVQSSDGYREVTREGVSSKSLTDKLVESTTDRSIDAMFGSLK
ncbi:nSTAND3 domain-containing NTPase [Streptomyces sp. SAS_270]|uniref:nSTAND3 domain-containing NTPase n=1 Tax=Streptomyces sp. SAS_270 TaxID=3412748 RepID=UPI00403D1593